MKRMKKRFLAFLVTLTLLASCMPALAAVSQGFRYSVQADGTAEITGYQGAVQNYTLVIPTDLDGHKVTAVGDKAFQGNQEIMLVYLPAGVRTIGENAFAFTQIFSCSSDIQKLRSSGASDIGIQLREGITRIGEGAFAGTFTGSARIPASVTEIPGNPFFGSTHLSSIEVAPGNSVFYAENGVLFSRDNGKQLLSYPCAKAGDSYTVPRGTTLIGRWAFTVNNLTRITIPDSVTMIGASAFAYSQKLTSLTLPEGVQAIGNSAFAQCPVLREVSVPESVTRILPDAFRDCPELTVSVVKGSYAEQYCRENNVKYKTRGGSSTQKKTSSASTQKITSQPKSQNTQAVEPFSSLIVTNNFISDDSSPEKRIYCCLDICMEDFRQTFQRCEVSWADSVIPSDYQSGKVGAYYQSTPSTWKAICSGKTVYDVSGYGNNGRYVCLYLPDDRSLQGEQTISLYYGSKLRIDIRVKLTYNGSYTTGNGWGVELLDYQCYDQ